MKNTENQKKALKKPSAKAIARIIAIFIIGISLLLGIVFSLNSFSSSYSLGQDYSDRYEALVGVYNSKSDSRIDNQPNGDSAEGANILSERLNPLGMKDIRISRVGSNYLSVSAPRSLYNNIQEFRNNIKRSGSVLLLDSNFSDIQWTSETERNPLSNYFTSAKSTTKTFGSDKVPYVSFGLNGTNFSDLITSKTSSDSGDSGQSTDFSMYVFSDMDQILNDARDYYDVSDKSDEDDRYDDFYDNILLPLRSVYESTDTTAEVKTMLYNLFYGRYEYTNSSNQNTSVGTGSLITDTFQNVMGRRVLSGDDVKKLVNSFSFTYSADTSTYVYDGEAKTDDFKDEGRYYNKVSLQNGSGNNITELSINAAFSNLAPNVLKIIFSANSDIQNYFYNNYVLYGGKVGATVTENPQSSSQAYFDSSKFYTPVSTQSKAKISASIFNAASEGFSFIPAKVSTVKPSVTKVELIVSMAVLLILVIALATFMLFLYRLLALFAIIIAVTSISLTLLTLNAFSTTIGLEAILGSIMLLAISFEISSMLFALIKHNIFSKKRGIKTSFKIAIKESIGVALDISVTIIIASICLFWIGSNTLKTLATIMSLGSAYIIIFTIIVGFIWMLMLSKTNIFDKAKNLLLININTENSFSFRELKLQALTDKKMMLVEKGASYDHIDKKIADISKKIKVSDAKTQEKDLKFDKNEQIKNEKLITKIKNKIEKLKESKSAKKYTEVISKKIGLVETKIADLNTAIKEIDKTANKKEYMIGQRKLIKLSKKLSILHGKKDIPSANLDKKINVLNLKIEDIKYVASLDAIADDKDDRGAYTKKERRKIKRNEQAMKFGIKILLIIFAIFAALSTILIPTVGANLDKSFGGSIVYTVWGNSMFENPAGSVLTDIYQSDIMPQYIKTEAKDLEERLNKIAKNSGSTSGLSTDYYNQTADKYGKFVSDILTDSSVYKTSLFDVDLPRNFSVTYTSGTNYNNGTSSADASSNEQSTTMWISITATAKTNTVSRAIKSVFFRLFGADSSLPVSADRGFTSKRVHPYTDKNLLKQAMIVGVISIIVLLIYIIIRYKWTYYVALAISILFTILMTIGAIVIFRINVDISTITLCTIAFIITIFVGMSTISSIRSIMNRKNTKSLNKFYDKQINVSVEIKHERRRVHEEIRKKVNEFKLTRKIKKEELTQDEIFEMKKEIKFFKLKMHLELHTYIRNKKNEVRLESRRNNYLYEIVSEIFSRSWKKLLIIGCAVGVITVALALGLVGNWTNSFIFLISFIIIAVTSQFLLIPIWVKMEQFRIHNKLATKRFINQIVISSEEQLVEDIND